MHLARNPQKTVTPRLWCSLSPCVKSTRSRVRGKLDVGARDQPTWRSIPAICRNRILITSQLARYPRFRVTTAKTNKLRSGKRPLFSHHLLGRRMQDVEMLFRKSQQPWRNKALTGLHLKGAGPAPESPALATPAPKQYRSNGPSINSVSRAPQSCPRPRQDSATS